MKLLAAAHKDDVKQSFKKDEKGVLRPTNPHQAPADKEDTDTDTVFFKAEIYRYFQCESVSIMLATEVA